MEAHVTVVLLVYFLVGLFTATALFESRIRRFWCGLLVLNVVLFCIMSLDYRLRANEFYMLFWVNGVFLLSRHPRWTIPITILSFYFWAGILKVNREWLSGAILYHDLWLIPRASVPAACLYVVILELVFIWGLLARRGWVVAGVIGQLALFHLQSLSQIHWIYPLLMGAILSWFVLDRLVGARAGRADLGGLLGGRAPRGAYAVMAAFAVLQLVPSLYRGDSTLTGQGRVFALHMFEARQQCDVTATHQDGTELERFDLKLASLAPRMVCDPTVYFSRATTLCRTRRTLDPSFDVHLLMRAKRTTDLDFKVIIDEPRFCAGEHEYRLWRNNDWLR